MRDAVILNMNVKRTDFRSILSKLVGEDERGVLHYQIHDDKSNNNKKNHDNSSSSNPYPNLIS